MIYNNNSFEDYFLIGPSMMLNPIRRFFSSRTQVGQAQDAQVASIPKGERIYAIGDIHGRVDLLSHLHRQIKEDAESAPRNVRKTIIYLGDYVDRGLNSKEVIDLLLVRDLGDFHTVYLKGNHEEILLAFLKDASIGSGWFAIGGAATALSYGIRIPAEHPSSQRFEYVRRELQARVPDDHMRFLSRLELTYQLGSYLFVHAGVKPGVPLDRQSPHDLLWIRDEFRNWNGGFQKVIVHGHSLSHHPEYGNQRIGIDTGAYATNVLTCLVLQDRTHWFLSTGL